MEGLRNNKLAEDLLHLALAQGASDMHIEPDEQGVRVRIRVDGLLQQLCVLPRAQQSTLLTQLKVWSGMDIAEKRVPQDGRMLLKHVDTEVDLRLSSLPTVNGEKLAIRFLQRQDNLLSLEQLQFSDSNLQRYRQLFHQPNGLVLLTGPTGSGKTTTLYATLQELDAAANNIITLEDPVEYKLPGINQVAVNRRSGLTFAAGLRSVVRQDPDVIMLGEIRDEETAAMAVHAALTGHLLLSTLHTNDAIGAVYRLLDMGIADYLLAAGLRGVLAQRLVRRPCRYCGERRLATAAELQYLGRRADESLQVVQAHGCEHCHGTGYRGRLALHELIVFDKRMQQLLVNGADETELLREARKQGWCSLYADAVDKVLQGATTVEELWRVDLHLTPASVPMVRVDGSLQPLRNEFISREKLEKALLALLPEQEKRRLLQTGEIDTAFSDRLQERCRLNVYRLGNGYAAAIRLLPKDIPDCNSLGLPQIISQLAGSSSGLLLVTGATGSGKGTTLASLVQQINQTRAVHVLTLEDPIEYVYPAGLALINQREVGRDTRSFASGLRSALRQDPDVILVGELRDAETIGIALTAAETGHLVLATLHTQDAAGTVNRILDVLPDRQHVCTQLADCLLGICCQRLLPRCDRAGRAAAFEVLVATPAMRNLIREGRTHQLQSYLQTGARYGMQTMEDAVKALQLRGIIA